MSAGHGSRPGGCALALLAALLAGCASLPDEAADDGERAIPGGEAVALGVRPCTTQLVELMQRLGTPSRDGRLGNARVLTWIVEWDPLVKYLGVMANEGGTVVDVVWNLPSEVTWSPTDRCRQAQDARGRFSPATPG